MTHEQHILIEQVLSILPQTQCTQCGYEGCAPYANAIVLEGAKINRCPPGGMAGVEQLAKLTQQSTIAIDPDCGQTKPRHIAVIDPNRCIGCTLCITACPVDAIVGAPKAMHQVINAACTGCDLCLPPCPVDCIDMVRVDGLLDWTIEDATLARQSYEAKKIRVQNFARENEERLAHKAQQKLDAIAQGEYDLNAVSEQRKQAVIAAAMAKARARRATTPTANSAPSE